MTISREQVAQNALRVTKYATGMCARFSRECAGFGALGDFDNDGDADAVDMLKATRKLHTEGGNPPLGVFCFWSGGSKGHGHVAPTVTDTGVVRSTDWPRAGQVNNVGLATIAQAWPSLTYEGWTDEPYGKPIRSEADERLGSQIDKWRERRAILKLRLARARARRKALKAS